VKDRYEYHLQLFQSFNSTLNAFLKETPDHDQQSREETAALLAQTAEALEARSNYLELGQQLLGRLVSHFPAFTPHVQRDLFWFFGGDCLHFLSDEEITKFQQLEERYYEAGEEADYSDLRARAFGLH